MRKVSEDYIGTCQACFGEYKVNENSKRIVLHGYQRPGWGSIHGQCEGTDHAPFEHDCSLSKQIIKSHEAEAKRQSELQSAMSADGFSGPLTRHWEDYNRQTGRHDPKSENVAPGHAYWDYTLKSAIQKAVSAHQYHTSYAEYLQKMVDAWKPGKIVGIDVPATGKFRALRKAFDPEEAKAQAKRDAEKAARLAKPGKLKIGIYRPEPEIAMEPGPEKYSAFLAQRKEFVDGHRAKAKEMFEGKLIVREGSDLDLPRAYRHGSTTYDVVWVHPAWEHRDEITKHYPGAVRVEDEAKRVTYLWAEA